MSVTPRLPLIALYNYTDGAIFSKLTVPEGLSKPTFISRLLLTRGEFSVLYPDPEYMTEAIGAWTETYADTFARIYAAMSDEYNPLHNFDRYEEYTDTEDTNKTGSSSAQGRIDSDAESKVSAFNESAYQPDSRSITGSSSASSDESTEDVGRELVHDGHLYGNIGVTTSQQMLTAEINLRLSTRMYDIMADKFAEELLILVY